MRILITGSRDWTEPKVILDAIIEALTTQFGTDHVIIHGGAIGADSMADAAARALNIPVEVHPARWAEHQPNCSAECRAERRCKRAGHVRNSEMVASGADICLAFIKDESPGTTGCASIAERSGIYVKRYFA